MIDHSDKTGATPTWKKTFGHHPLLTLLDRPEIGGGEALGGLLRTGNAGSNTASDHIIVQEHALKSLPRWRQDPDGAVNPGYFDGYLMAWRRSPNSTQTVTSLRV